MKTETVRWLRRALRRGKLTRAALGGGLRQRDEWRSLQQRLCRAETEARWLQRAPSCTSGYFEGDVGLSYPVFSAPR